MPVSGILLDPDSRLPRCAFRDGEQSLAITGRTAPDSRLPTPSNPDCSTAS
ncbi:hypothetical protein BJP36_37765 [Moorena producens JHB]|uniref:Uncharacterized protein n=1 Tax=Moorena producens (strain JHB) TaxID=1454205 RepID=A0A9Q9UWG3_MOOP1|nr:hypothetical protein [Moorena producens]WAN69844.1 hypothetical protein BJP36_37765 [Moorena producens JHB]